MHVRIGQAATGHRPDDDVMPIWQGTGANGKSTMIAGVAGALGEFYTLVSDRQITARLIAQNSITFDVTSSLMVTSNYRPVVEQTDHGTWRRLALVRFPYRFDDGSGDPNLRDRVKRDAAVHRAVLAWIVAGARRWYELDRVMPPAPKQVLVDTQEWRAGSDVIMSYWLDRLIPDQDAHVIGPELYRDFVQWLAPQGPREWSERLFVERFEHHQRTEEHHVERRRVRRDQYSGLSRSTTVIQGRSASCLA